MNESQENTKDGAIKTLAIIGFIAVIVIGVWLSVQIVRVIPGAFSSLASVADSVQNNKPLSTLTVASGKSIVNIGEPINVSWTDLKRTGAYNFSYTCTEGTSVEIQSENGEFMEVQCDTIIPLPEEAHTLNMIVSSEKKRFVDLPYTISFNEPNVTESLFQKNGKVTVVNATIPQSVEVATESVETEIEEEATIPVVTPASQVAAPIETIISVIPESQENGFTDLQMKYVGVGVLNGSSFTPKGSITSDDRGAIRFDVKNIGTKTSDSWTFEATLPSGFVFKSAEQMPLKPNETSTYTLGFDNAGEDGSQPISAELSAPNDTNDANNSFNWIVKIED